ncbi:MAG: PepSY domain-containing protein [Acidimicrobiales bacterium]
MTESLPPTRRWRHRTLFAIVGALGALGVASGALLSTGHQAPLPAAVRLAAASAPGAGGAGGAGGADQAAVNYVDSHYPGPGAPQVLKTEPDADRGVSVYDVRVVAPNGTTYVVHVQQSNDAVLFANPAEQQVTPRPTTATAPPATSPPSTSPPATSPPPTTEPLQDPEAVETPETPATTGPGASSTDHSPDRSGTSTEASSPDHTKATTSGNDN